MTPNEIRNCTHDIKVPGGTPEAVITHGALLFQVLAEIAAQLAETKEAREPRWVKLRGPDDSPVYVDATKLMSVVGIEADRTILQDDFRRERVIFEEVTTVLAKLGIVVPA